MPDQQRVTVPRRRPWEVAEAGRAQPVPASAVRPALVVGRARVTAATDTTRTTRMLDRAHSTGVQERPADEAAVAASAVSDQRELLVRRRRRGTKVTVAAVMVLLAAAFGGVGALWWLGSGLSEQTNPGEDVSKLIAEPTPQLPAQPAATGAPDTMGAPCPTARTGPVWSGREPGGVRGGEEVIKYFQHSYYVARSAVQARTVLAATAMRGDARWMQSFIDKLAPHTSYCLRITTLAPGSYAVMIAEQQDLGKPPQNIYQIVRTADSGGRTWIVSIDSDPTEGRTHG